MKTDSVVAIIPARGGSKGIKNKNIMRFCGKPLIYWSIQQALGSKLVEEVYVSSDDKDILKVASACGAKTIMRPSFLATDTACSEDALAHAVAVIEQKKNVDVIVFLQATSPLRVARDIDGALKEFYTKEYDSLFSVAVLDDFCCWKKQDDKLRSMTFDYRNRGRRQDREKYYLENGSIYIFKAALLKKNKNRLGGKMGIYEMPYWQSYEIDEKKDVAICEFFMENKIIGQGNSIRGAV